MPKYVAIFEKFCGTLSCSFKDFVYVTETKILPCHRGKPIILSNRLIARIIEKRLTKIALDERYKVVEYGPNFRMSEAIGFWKPLSPLEQKDSSSSNKTSQPIAPIMGQKEGQK